MNTIPNYSLDELVLQSSDVVLHRGRRIDDGVAVTIKTLGPSPGRPAAQVRLRHEFQLLRQLDVPGVPHALALETFPGGRALILEAVAGESLATVLARGPLGVRAALGLGVALAGVLAGVHQQGLIHKRLAPQFIVYDAAGPAVSLVDFGSASPLAQEPARSTLFVGDAADLAYISPEQTGRMNRTVDMRSDLYALGVILYEALAGATPFARLTEPLALVHAHIARRPPPLREVAAGVPEMVSRVIDRLLAKTAEDRYQTANGLRLDLVRCLEALGRGPDVPEFALGSHDKDGKLRVPQRLYGRGEEVAALLAAFDRVHAGGTELLLISGYSGIGKSVLVREVNKPIAERGGVFIAGKFDQVGRSVPYAALGQALRELTHLLLCEAPAALAVWKERIQGALGANGQLLLDLVPDLRQIVGPQPALPQLAPTEAQHRLETTLRRFVRAIGSPSHPLVLFLDDLQWIDPASLHLVHVLLADDEQSHLLIVGAYRDNEVGAAHILTAALDTLRESGVKLAELSLQPLGSASVLALLADALDLPRAEVEALAAALVDKTKGNPFFLGQYLGELCGEGLLRFDGAAQRWTWDMAGIAGRVVADNVVELVTTKLRRLPADTQQVVTYAAAIGHQFDAATLATIQGVPVADAMRALWPALAASVVVPIGEDYRFLARADGEAGEASEVRPQDVWFKFIHDRVQQAAYALTPVERLAKLHLEIGRLLVERHGGHANLPTAAIFEAAKHLGRGAQEITDPEERLALARLDLVAGRRAKAAAAYEAAAAFLAAGVDLLGVDCWDAHHELTYALHVEHGACEHLAGHPEAAERVFERLVPHTRTDLDFADLCSLRASLYITEGRFPEVLECCLTALARLGVEFPRDPAAQQAAFMAGIADVLVNLGGRPIASLVDAPRIDDPRLQRVLILLNLMTPAAFYASLGLFCLGLVTHVNTSLKHGNTEDSSFGFVSYGFLLIALFGQFTVGHEFGQLGLALNERFGNMRLACQLHVVFANGLHFRRPLREGLELARKGYRIGLETGDMNYLTYGCYMSVRARLDLGEELVGLAADLEQFLRVSMRAKEVTSTLLMQSLRLMIAALQGEAPGEEEDARAVADAGMHPPVLCRHHMSQVVLRYLQGDHAGALAAGERAEPLLATCAGLYESTVHPLYFGLTLAAVARAGGEADRELHAERIARCQQSLEQWAISCPENYAHRAALLRAEVADLAGDPAASELYRLAIESAERSELLPEQALASVVAARHHLANGRRDAARPLLQAARRGYTRWGATSLVSRLDELHGALLFAEAPAQERYIHEGEQAAPIRTADTTFDALTVLQVAQTLAGEIVLSRLIEQLMRTVMTHAGAQRGALILERGGQLLIEAILTHGPDVVQLDVHEPVDGSERLASSLVHYVARTRETVVLGDASRVDRFAADRYIGLHKPKSLLCLALTHQGRLLGLLYLENNLATNVFAAEQVDLIRMLSSHAAISVQNALLYADIEHMTAELRARNVELGRVNLRLQDELAERERAEQGRMRLQEEVIQFQNARLAELSTPMIPINDKIMVMPIIGTVDQGRAARVVEAALTGAHRTRAAVVILDVTGLRDVDASAIDSLMQTARALRLLGTAVVLSGVGPEVAQTIISLGVDLSAIVACGNLESGIAYALAQVEGARTGAVRRR
jgi:predicted ATPase/anti-anti-sigma regulatory factor/GAF domain-containing protein